MPTVSLVLGAGGARGYAHIGVIEELEARGYEVVCVSGSSMGALIGGLYAAGGLHDYREWVESLHWVDVMRLLDLTFKQGTFRGEKVFAKLKELIGDPLIESLPISYTAVVTDLASTKEIWFQRGSLLQAMRASIAVPGVVTPVIDNGRILVDGGVLNPLPITPTVSTHADLIIAVDLNSQRHVVPSYLLPDDLRDSALPKGESVGRIGLLLSSMEVMQGALTRYKISGYAPDLVVRIPKDVGGFHEFHRAKELVAIGRRLARYQIAAYEDLHSDLEQPSVDE